MTQPVLTIASTFILMIAIWSLLKFRTWGYTSHHWTVSRYEDPLFLFGLIGSLTIHSMITGSEYSAILSMAPWLIVSVKLIQHGREMSLR